jgi:hypothetical protein
VDLRERFEGGREAMLTFGTLKANPILREYQTKKKRQMDAGSRIQATIHPPLDFEAVYR